MRIVLALALAALALAFAGCAPAPEVESFDVVVYGATPGGVAAALNAAREGVRVGLYEPDGHVGGLTSGGLSNTDFKSFESVGGTFREFMQRVVAYYAELHGAESPQVIDSVEGGYYEPRVAREVFEKMLSEAGVEVLLDRRLVKADMEPSADGRKRIAQLHFVGSDKSEWTVQGAIYIDGTYEGDLIAAAGVACRVGCEAKSEYGESLAFDKANDYVQTYNFRICMTSDPENSWRVVEPPNYDRARYAPLLQYIADGTVKSLSNQGGDPQSHVLKIRPIPNKKADFNDNFRSPVSLSIVNINQPWPEGSPEVRRKIYDEYKSYSLGLLYFLGNDPEVPEEWRDQMSLWGLPNDEYLNTDHWTPALYVREGRRMVGRYIYTQNDMALSDDGVRAKLHPDSVAIGDYPMNCHGVWAPGPTEPRIGYFSQAVEPFQIPYGVLLPKDVDGLLAPVPLSASHVGFSAVRMEPTWTALGQAAGIAAAMALKRKTPLADLDVDRLQMELHRQGALTVYISDLGALTEVKRPEWDERGGSFHVYLNTVPPQSPYFLAAQYFGTKGFLHGLIDPKTAPQENREPTTGQWSSRRPYHELQPDRPMDDALAQRWLRMAAELGVKIKLENLTSMTRGEFLNALFGALPSRQAAN